MQQTLIEKIAQRFAVGLPEGHTVRAGDFLSIQPAHVMTHDNTAAIIPKFESMGAVRVHSPSQPVFALDHDIQNTSPQNLAKYARIEAFAKKHGVAFFPAGRGIGHQVMVEEGFVLPCTFVVGSDSHSNLYGALGALGTPVVRTDAAAIWATGRTWWQVPDIVRVNLTGKLQPGVSGKDVIIALCGLFNNDEVLNCCLEFEGAGALSLGIEERLTISNMTTEWGALAGVFPYDGVTREYLVSRAEQTEPRGFSPRGASAQAEACGSVAEIIHRLEADLFTADADAVYAKELDLDLAAVSPFVAGPNEVKTITPLPELARRNVAIDKAFLMSCVNGRLGDFRAAADVLEGKRVHDGVKLYVAAASSEVEREAKKLGLWQTLLAAGAIALPPGCGACIGLGEGVLENGEVGISATNRNFKGRMGSPTSQVYLASPAVVAASAVAGKIAGPDTVATGADAGSTNQSEPEAQARDSADAREAMRRAATCRMNQRPPTTTQAVQILPGFPQQLEGELLFVPQDNLNTDGIYGKEFTYQDNLAPEEMGAKAMLNYDPQFQALARDGDILIGGYNFGSGSSREQAATALKYRGIQMIIAGSYSQTFKRNAFNNGYIVIECPALVDELRSDFAKSDALTIRTGRQVAVDFTNAQIVASGPRAGRAAAEKVASDPRVGRTSAPVINDWEGKTYAFSPLGEVAQELIVKGGFEAVIRAQLEE